MDLKVAVTLSPPTGPTVCPRRVGGRLFSSAQWEQWVGGMQFVIPGCKVDPPKRLAAVQVELTFAALFRGELTHALLLAEAKRWCAARHGLREYLIGREQHSAPADPQRDEHFHIYIKAGRKFDAADRHHTTIFDVRGRNGRILHPEVQSVGMLAGDRERVVRYNMKDGDWIGELETPLVFDPQRDAAEAADGDVSADEADSAAASTATAPGWARMLTKATTVKEGMELLAEHSPHIYFLNGERIESMLSKRLAAVQRPQLFTLADFNQPPLPLELPTVLWGKTNCGKSAYARAHFQCPLVVRRRDDLKMVHGGTDGIIFDDCTFADWTPEDALCLLEWDEPRSLPARYNDARVAADIPIIFTTNK